jgi:hypothetical protein
LRIGADRYGLNQLRHGLRKLKAHRLLERDGKRYAYRLTEKGTKVAMLFLTSTNNSATRSPTASFTIKPTKHHDKTANAKPPFIRPTAPFKTSSACSMLPDVVEVFLFMNETVRI